MSDFIGNTMGNLFGKGLIVGDGEQTYIALPEGILKLANEEASLIYGGPCSHLNLTDMDLYFIDNRNRIIALNREDAVPYVLVERTGRKYDEINHMIVCDHFLYFSVYWGGAVYRIDLESGKEDFLFFATCLSLAIDQDYIYYSDESVGFIQRMSLAEIDQLLSLSHFKLAELWFDQHELSHKEMPDFIRRGMADKIDLSILLDPEVLNDWDGCYGIQFVGSVILYLACKEEDGLTRCGLHALNSKTGEVLEMIEDSVESFNVFDEWILIKKSEDGCLYRMDSEGDIRKLLGEEIESIFVVEEEIWCTFPEGRKLMYLDIEGKHKEVIHIEED